MSDCGAGGLGLVKMCTVDCYHDETFCKNSTMAGNNKHKMALDKYCNSKWIQRLIFFVCETIKRLWRLLPSSGTNASHTLLSYKNLIRGGKQICRCTDLGEQKVTLRQAVNEPSSILGLLMKLNCCSRENPKPGGLNGSVVSVDVPSTNNKTGVSK